ncbi:hypothetical protein [Roseateles caseinilyticus]|uniref:hypothetical protein n=1 Tax=Pelomonas caseinilytica TaxID=2906763 RepID=UPI0032C2431F
MAALRQVGQVLAGGTGGQHHVAVESRWQPAVAPHGDQTQRHPWPRQAAGVEVGRQRHAGHHGREAGVDVAARRRVGEAGVEHALRQPELEAVQPAAGQARGQAHAGGEVLGQMLLAVGAEAFGRPDAAGQAQHRVSAGRHAEAADAVQRQSGEARVRRHTVDGAADLGRPQRPAVGPRVAGVAPVVAPVQRQGDHEAGLHQGRGQGGVHPRAASRAMGDDDQPPIAGRRRRAGGQVQLQVTAGFGAAGRGGGIEQGDGFAGVVAGQGEAAERGRGLGGQAQQEAGEQGGGVHDDEAELKRPQPRRPAARRLAETCGLQLSARCFRNRPARRAA